MKKILSILLVLVLVLALVPGASAARVMVSRQSLRVDGKVIDCQKYNIDDRNYFMLRDLALLLNGTGSRFSVEWDGERGCVTVTTGAEYVPDGSELDLTMGDRSDTAVSSRQSIYIDGVLREDLTVYNIGDHNYFQLKELGAALGFFVDYDEPSNTAIILSRAPAEPTPWRVREETETREETVRHAVSTYSPEGRLLTRSEESMGTVWTETWTYDDLGRPLKQVRGSRNTETGEVLYRETLTWEYDRWGNLVRESLKGDEDRWEWVYTYDERGNLLRKWQGESGSEYAYDDRGVLLRQTVTAPDGTAQVTEYTRDEAGRILLERCLNGEGKELYSTARTWKGDLCLREVYTVAALETVTEYTYDEAGNLLLKTILDPERTTQEAYAYDEAGRLLRREYYGGIYDWGEARTRYICEYDDSGRLLREAYTDYRGDTWTLDYTYNEAGDPVRLHKTEWTVYLTDTVITYDPAAGKETRVITHSVAPAERLVLAQEAVTLEVGEVLTLGFRFEPQGAPAELVTWTSSDPAVVKAESFGKLTALAPGEATVTAAAESGLTARCTVTVK